TAPDRRPTTERRPTSTTRWPPGWTRPTPARAPPPSSSRSRASSSPAGSRRRPAPARPSTDDRSDAMTPQPRPPRPARYGRYAGGPDPLAPPIDLREALDEIADDVMYGYSPDQALRELLRRGNRNAQGLDDLAGRVQQRRRDLL